MVVERTPDGKARATVELAHRVHSGSTVRVDVEKQEYAIRMSSVNQICVGAQFYLSPNTVRRTSGRPRARPVRAST